MLFTLSTIAGLLLTLPRLRADSKPIFVLCRIISRSNSANTTNILNKAFSLGVEASNELYTNQNLLSFNWSVINNKSLKRNNMSNGYLSNVNTFKVFKTEFANQANFSTVDQLEIELNDYVHWFNNIRIHGTLGYLTPTEFKLQPI